MKTSRAPLIFKLARRERGLSLIEVLISMVVLSIGLLGLAGLQLNGIKVNQGATYRWRASELAAELADLMRANKSEFSGTSCTACTTSAPGAGPTNAVANDAWTKWLNTRLAALPGAACSYAVDANGLATIDIRWTDTRSSTVGGTAYVSSSDSVAAGVVTSDLAMATQL